MSVAARHTLVVARQAGSAAALAPVVRDMKARGEEALVCAAVATARRSFEAAHIVPNADLPSEPSVDRLAAWLAQRSVDSLLTGTSFEAALDGQLWSAARMAGVPAVALLDHWCNYAERFSDQAPFDCLPDALAVMDDAAASALRAAGFPPKRLHITGHPHLDEITPVTLAERSAARRLFSIAEDRRVITFASELIPADQQRHLGYTAATALATICAAVAHVAPDALLIIRPHPREETIGAVPSGEPETIVARTGSPRDAIAASDVMTGMRTMLLLEAALAGVPTLSVRPGGGPEHYLDTHAHLIVSARDANALSSALRGALDGHVTPESDTATLLRHETASGRVIRLVEDMRARRSVT